MFRAPDVWKKLVFALALFATLPPVASAITEGAHTEHIEVYLDHTPSLQRGAKYFVNHCLGCHSAKYVRYARLAEDLELTEAQVEQNFIFTGQKIGDTMISSMRTQDGGKWFRSAPPDLSVIARSRGVDWLYGYLQNFYLDPSRPFGVNNLTYPDVSMPHVLGDLQGWQKPVYEDAGQGGGETQVIGHLELVKSGLLTPEEYDEWVRDLVTFLAYISEPAQLARQRIGFWVLLFLVAMLALSYLLKKEYWKDVH